MNVKLERNAEVDYSISHCKGCIERVVANGGYSVNNRNDILNTYRIGKITGLEFVNMNITLKKVSDDKTEIQVSCVEAIRNSGHQIAVDQILDAFMERFSKALVGAPDDALKTVSQKGCLGVALALIIFSSALLGIVLI